MKYSFFDDYSEGAHEEILAAVSESNKVQELGYCNDDYCQRATQLIQKAFACPGADVHYLPNGTIANVVGLASMLKSFEGVISPTSGHINSHEAGALEAAGHKIIYVDAPDGKLTPALIDEALSTYEDEHTVVPRVVYFTQATELGTLYTFDELQACVEHAKAKGLLTFLDGARLAMALASETSHMTMEDIGSLGLDMFYIGGTKNGGIYGEAVVVNNNDVKKDFRNHMKQRGALMAKGRFMGQQFARFFENDNLWIELAKHANAMGALLYDGLVAKGIEFESVPGANQIFPTFENATIEKLQKDYGFYTWKKIDEDHTQVRLVCSWATEESAIQGFLQNF